jgi:hypothetical protein
MNAAEVRSLLGGYGLGDVQRSVSWDAPDAYMVSSDMRRWLGDLYGSTLITPDWKPEQRFTVRLTEVTVDGRTVPAWSVLQSVAEPTRRPSPTLLPPFDELTPARVAPGLRHSPVTVGFELTGWFGETLAVWARLEDGRLAGWGLDDAACDMVITLSFAAYLDRRAGRLDWREAVTRQGGVQADPPTILMVAGLLYELDRAAPPPPVPAAMIEVARRLSQPDTHAAAALEPSHLTPFRPTAPKRRNVAHVGAIETDRRWWFTASVLSPEPPPGVKERRTSRDLRELLARVFAAAGSAELIVVPLDGPVTRVHLSSPHDPLPAELEER